MIYDSIYTSNLKYVLKWLYRKYKIRCKHIRELTSPDKRFRRYILICENNKNDSLLFEVYEYIDKEEKT